MYVLRLFLTVFGCSLSVYCIVYNTKQAKRFEYLLFVLFTISFATLGTLSNLFNLEEQTVLFLATITIKSMMQFVFWIEPSP